MTARVLLVTEVNICPPHGGQCIRSHNLIDSLCQRFEVVVLAPRVNAPCELTKKVSVWLELPRHPGQSLRSKIDNIRYILMPRPSWVKSLRAACQQHRPQVTWFTFGHWGQYASIPRQFGSRTIMDTHNIQSELTRQEYEALSFGRSHVANRLRYIAQRSHERYLFQRFDRIVSVSERDRRYHARFVGQDRSVCIPNYISESAYRPEKPIARADNLVAMTGNFAGFQNKQGVNWFLTEVWPEVCRQVPQARLQLIGLGAGSLFNQGRQPPNVTCIGVVPTVAPYLRQATVAVVPLLHGSGTRFKILEACACEIPVVSTTLGAQGIDLVPGQSIVLADSGADFAREIVALLQDGEKRLRLAQNGLDVLRNEYSFEVNTRRIRQLVEEVIIHQALLQ